MCYIHNRSLRSSLDFKTPYFVRFNENCSLDHIHEFGQFCIIRNENVPKLNERGTLARWLGPADESKGHLTWHDNKITTERNVQFLTGPPARIEGEQNDEFPMEPELRKQKTSDTSDIRSDTSDTSEPNFTIRRSARERQPTKRAKGLSYDDDFEDEQDVIELPMTQRAKGINYNDEMNMAIYLT